MRPHPEARLVFLVIGVGSVMASIISYQFMEHGMTEPQLLALSFIAIFGILYWVAQLIRVMLADAALFESHTHRLVWMLVVLSTGIIGAIWFGAWAARHNRR